MDQIIGSTIRGVYLVESEIGSGGMGVVYKARNTSDNGLVAIKVLSSKGLSDPDRLMRFRQEAKVSMSISHPNIVKVHEVGFEEIAGQERDYIVMEFVDGTTLSRKIAGQALPVREALGFGIQIARALTAAHEAGITHRDVKPSNVLVEASGRVKLADFGLAKLTEPPADPFAETGSVQINLTHDGTIIGSVAYMSPEQARGLPVDHRSDIYSFGALFYEMLTGKPAFEGATTIDKLSAILTREPEELPDSVPPELGSILARCMRKEAKYRWQSARDLCSALQDFERGGDSASSTIILRRTSTRRTAIAAIASGVAAGGITSLYFASKTHAPPAYQRLTFRTGDVTGARFAPGNMIAFTAAWDGSPPALFTCQPGNREPRRLDLPPARLAGVTPENEAAVILDETSTLSVVSLGGGEPRPRLEAVVDACWAPDGRAMAVTVAAQRGKFEVQYPIGNKVHESFQRPPQSLKVSPDGNAVAFFEFVPDFGDYRVTVVDRGEKGRAISSGWRGFGTLLWHPNGRQIWLSATRARTDPMVYSVGLNGAERLVTQTPDWLVLHDIDKAERLLVAPTQSRLSIRAGRVGDPELKALSWLDSSSVYDFTSDDRQLIFAELSYAEGRNPSIYIRNLDGSPARRLGEGSRPSLSPDGTKVACLTRSGAASSLSILPNGPGEPLTLPFPGWNFEAAAWMPDSAHLLVYGGPVGEPSATHLTTARGGTTRKVCAARAIKASPDGQHAAGVDGARLIVVPIAAQTGKEAPKDLGPTRPDETVIRWSAAGLFTAYGENGLRAIDRISAEDGRRRRIQTLSLPEPGAGFLDPVVLSPSGKAFAFSYQRDLATLHLATGLV